MKKFVVIITVICALINFENVQAQTEINVEGATPVASQVLEDVSGYLNTPYRMEFVLNHGYLAITDIDNQPSLHIVEFSGIDNYGYLAGLGREGRGPSEYLSPNVVIDAADENAFYVHDANGMKLVKYSSELSPLPKEEQMIRPNGLPITVHKFNDQFIVNGITVNGKFELLDNEGNSIRVVGDPISLGSDLPSSALAQIWHSYSAFSPSEQKIAIFSKAADRAELFDLSTGEKVSEFVDSRFPVPDVRIENVDGTPRMLPGRNAKNAFSWVTSNGNYLYALYSGEPDDSETSNYGKYIIMFDWDLNLLEKYELDHHSFTILANNEGDIFSIQHDPVPAIRFISAEDLQK